MPADGSAALALDESVDVDLLDAALESAALARLLEEVRGEEAKVARSYNRTYNRHNR